MRAGLSTTTPSRSPTHHRHHNIIRPPRTRLGQCCHYSRIVTTFLFSHVGMCAVVLAYAFLGAFTFSFLESSYEGEVRNRTRDMRQDLVKSLWNLTQSQPVLVRDEWVSSARKTLETFEENIIKAVKRDGFDGSETGDLQWSMTGAMLYSIIVITTIGYGNIAPKTILGRLVTMVYAIVGIPLMLLFLSKIGDVMAHSFRFLYWKCCYALCIKQKKRKRHHHHHRRHNRRYHSGRGIEVVSNQPTSSTPITEIPLSPMTPIESRARPLLHSSGNPFTNHVDAGRVPIITNKYALQTEIQEQQAMEQSFPTVSTQTPNHTSSSRLPSRLKPNLPPLDLTGGGRSSRSPTTTPRQLAISDLPPQVAVFNEDSSSSVSTESSDEEEEGNVPIIMCMSLVVGYICGGAWLFRQWEQQWSYLDSAYFCFVTLTTIGFGDMVPGAATVSSADTHEERTTLIICAIYLVFGMALIAMSFNLVQREVADSLKVFGRKIGIIGKGDNKNR